MISTGLRVLISSLIFCLIKSFCTYLVLENANSHGKGENISLMIQFTELRFTSNHRHFTGLHRHKDLNESEAGNQ